MSEPLPWRAAMTEALYGERGFYRRPEGPAGHFRTSSHRPRFATAVLRLAAEVDAGLGLPDRFDLVDLGAGRGELLAALAAYDLPGRWRLCGVDVVPRPPGLPAGVGWSGTLPAPVSGLLLANEWLDTVPLDVVVGTRWGPRLVLVAPDGTERLGPAPGPGDRAWLDAWWPVDTPGARAEVGRPRDEAWATAVAGVTRGLVVAVDYGHVRAGRPPGGTLAGYRSGRAVPPVPDGSCDLTAHVALDACAAAVRADRTLLTTQRAALRGLGVTGERPPLALAGRDPAAYLAGLSAAGEAYELTDPGGLGGFGWLVHAVGLDLPAPLTVGP